jgi:hypothetical protein
MVECGPNSLVMASSKGLTWLKLKKEASGRDQMRSKM